jgi:CRISPR-associated protein Cst2
LKRRAPDSIVFRWTDDFAPRMLYAFQADSEGPPTVPQLVRLVRAGDIDPQELVVGGVLAEGEDGAFLAERGVPMRLEGFAN